VNLDEITTGPLTAISDLIDLEESLTRLEESFAPWAEFDLSLIHANYTSDLKDEGRQLVSVTTFSGDNHMHIRVFDDSGEMVFDKSESELVSGMSLKTLKGQLNDLPYVENLHQETKQAIVGTVASIAGTTPWAFRGQPKTYSTLVPSFQRIFTTKKSVGAAEIIEHDLMQTFRRHYSGLERTSDMPQPFLIDNGFDLRCLSVMQHYGVPTRLLDWTGHFWTAVYFACAGNPNDDAELWYYDRTIFQPQINEFPELADLVATNSAPQRETDILFQRGTKLLAELDFQLTPRMCEQAAHHTVCSDVFADHVPLLQTLDTSDNGFRRVLISSSCKEKSLRFLEEHKNKTASTIFPDVEGLNRFLHWHLETLVTTIL